MATDSSEDTPVSSVEEETVSVPKIAACQWGTRYRLRLCNRALDGDHHSLCILHDPDPDKDRDGKFSRALEEKIKADAESDAIHIDLSGVVFPGDADLRRRVFNKGITFRYAHFSGAAYFWDCQFSGETYFGNTHFSGTVDFSDSQFWRVTHFSEARFSGAAIFNNVEFIGVAYFPGLQVQESLTFRGQTFLSADANQSASFQQLNGESARRIRFEGVDLSQVSFLRTDVSQTRFVGCTWASKNGRKAIYDELAKEDPSLVADLYRQIRLNYEANRQEAEAGDFYIGQMEMRRLDRASYGPLYRVLLGVYRVLAMYGESYQRPVFFYFTFGLLFALLYLWGGFQVGDAQVRYGLGFDPGNVVQFGKDFVRAYVQALTAGGLFGTNLLGGQIGANLETSSWWVPAVRYINMLLDTFLVGFFIIALRRHFKR